MAQPGCGLINVKVAPDAAAILSALPTALLVVDPSDRIVEVNAAAEMLLGASETHMAGALLSDILELPEAHRESRDRPFAVFDIIVSTRRSGRFRADFHSNPLPDSPGWVLVSLNAGAGAQHKGYRFERRTGARAAIGVAAMLAHEIKNPLSGIRGAAQLLDGHALEADKSLTRLIQVEVDRIAKLIDQMESFTDTRPLELAPANIHEAVDHARQVALNGAAPSLKVTEHYDPSLPPARIDRDSLVQVVLNLLKNAGETAEVGTIRNVKLTTAYRHGVAIADGTNQGRRALPIELCVIDDGPGAPAEIADGIFDPFVSSKKAGRGLGLALVDKLVRDMGGIVQYSREGDPEMTVFRLLLPRAEGEG